MNFLTMALLPWQFHFVLVRNRNLCELQSFILRGHFLLVPADNEYQSATTVKPPNKGHIGHGPFVPCREVALFISEVLF